MSSPSKSACTGLETDAEILAQVVYASPTVWGTTPDEVLLGHVLVSLLKDSQDRMHLLAWPDGVRAMLPFADLIGSPQLNQAVVNTYRAAASGSVGPVVVGECS
jgi:hypothetical protein